MLSQPQSITQKGVHASSVDRAGGRTLVFVAFERFLGADFWASVARTPFCAILWRSPICPILNTDLHRQFGCDFAGVLQCQSCHTLHSENQEPLNGGVSNRGVSRSGLVLPFLSFFVLSRFFRDFSDLLGDGPGIFPIRPFSLSQPIKSTCEEQSRKGPRHNLDLSRKKWETPWFGTPPV